MTAEKFQEISAPHDGCRISNSPSTEISSVGPSAPIVSDDSVNPEALQMTQSNPSQPSCGSQTRSCDKAVVNLKDNPTTDDTGGIYVKDKVNRGTMTEGEDGKPPTCKYCRQRLSKLRKLEKIKSLRTVDFSGTQHTSQSCNQEPENKEIGCQTSTSLFERAEMSQRELRSLAMILGYRDGRPHRTETFCKCVIRGKERDCRCGEEDKYFEWVWDPENHGPAVTLQEQGQLVTFHKNYSCGTSAVRGQQEMDRDQYFWEIKMTTPVYGTDMMVGVGTGTFDFHKYNNTFCSLLGHDMDSWGISYDGRVQHGGRKEDYCSRFGQGAIIGIHLDMWHGTIAFFKNRQPLGVAFRGLRGRTLYPMACSTAARSGMKVICSRSFPSSLQFLCCRRLRQFVPAHLSVLDALAMPPGLRQFLANNMTWLLRVPHGRPPRPRNGYICPICMPLKSALEGCTDDEEGSSDEEGIDHIHHALGMDGSDEDSDGDHAEYPQMRPQHWQKLIGPFISNTRDSQSVPDQPSTSSAAQEERASLLIQTEGNDRIARFEAFRLRKEQGGSVSGNAEAGEGPSGSSQSHVCVVSSVGDPSSLEPDTDDASPPKKARMETEMKLAKSEENPTLMEEEQEKVEGPGESSQSPGTELMEEKEEALPLKKPGKRKMSDR